MARLATTLSPDVRCFFKPVVLHLELADLPVETVALLFDLLVLAVHAVAEDLGDRLKQLLLPETDLVGMDAELLGELVYRPLALDRLQGDLGFELVGELSAAHETPFLGSRYTFYLTVSFGGSTSFCSASALSRCPKAGCRTRLFLSPSLYADFDSLHLHSFKFQMSFMDDQIFSYVAV